MQPLWKWVIQSPNQSWTPQVENSCFRHCKCSHIFEMTMLTTYYTIFLLNYATTKSLFPFTLLPLLSVGGLGVVMCGLGRYLCLIYSHVSAGKATNRPPVHTSNGPTMFDAFYFHSPPYFLRHDLFLNLKFAVMRGYSSQPLSSQNSGIKSWRAMPSSSIV